MSFGPLRCLTLHNRLRLGARSEVERPLQRFVRRICLEPETIAKVRITDFDGRQWKKHAHELEHFSQEGV